MRDVAKEAKLEVVTGGLTEVVAYTIRADAKMFRILINGLYSDKPRAIIRELCTNALDSHVDAGAPDRPFTLRLPTRWDHTFSVRDYGVSLPHEDVMHLYSTVGASTKEGTNTQVGKFGLGSKVPFAYTDSFTVTAILNGEKRLYSAFIDSDGVPKIALFLTEPTDEENGIEVSFAVEEKDISAFKVAAKRVLFGFDMIPENNVEITKDDYTPLYEGAGWRAYQRNFDLGMNGAYVRQGCVLYPIDRQALQNIRPCQALTVLASEVLVIDMPIGTVDITPDRERLSYDPTTSKNLLDRLDAILDDVIGRFTAQLTEAPSLFEATKRWNKLVENTSSYELKQVLQERAKWRGRRVGNEIVINDHRMKTLRKHGINLQGVKTHRKNRRSVTRSEPCFMPCLTARTDRGVTFVYHEGETPKFFGYRLASVSSWDRSLAYLGTFKRGGFAEAALLASLGNPDEGFVKWVDLDKVEEFNRPEYTKTLASVKVFRDSGFYDGEVPDEDEDNIFFVHTYRGEPKRGDSELGISYLADVWNALLRCKIIPADSKLIGIPASRKDVARSLPEEWNDLFSVVDDLVLNSFDVTKAARAQAVLNLRNTKAAGSWMALCEKIAGGLASSKTTSPLLTFVEEVRPMLTEVDDTALHLGLVSLIKRLFPASKQAELLKDFDAEPHAAVFWTKVEAIKARYPLLTTLLELLNRGYYSSVDNIGAEHIPPILHYVTLVDATTPVAIVVTTQTLEEAEKAAGGNLDYDLDEAA
jgi:hypothetical protein